MANNSKYFVVNLPITIVGNVEEEVSDGKTNLVGTWSDNAPVFEYDADAELPVFTVTGGDAVADTDYSVSYELISGSNVTVNSSTGITAINTKTAGESVVKATITVINETDYKATTTEYTTTITVNEEREKSTECALTKVVYSNGFDAFINESAKTVTAYYMAGESAPTVSTTLKSDYATVDTSDGSKIIVTAEDGTTTATYTVTLSAVEPFTGKQQQFDGTETWIKTGGGYKTYDNGGSGGAQRDYYAWIINKNADNDDRIPLGKTRIYFFVDEATSITLINDRGTALSSNRAIKVYVNGVEKDSPTSMPKYNAETPASITIATGVRAMVEIASNQTGGDTGWGKIVVTKPTKTNFALSSENEVALWKGETSTITYSGNAGTVTFESSNTDVAIVSDAGVITAVAEGTATITVTDPGDGDYDEMSYEVTVTVNEHKNTVTENVEGESSSAIMHNNHKASDKNSATISGICTLQHRSGSGGIQAGSTTFTVDGNNYTCLKPGGANRVLQIVPADGVTITSVVAYITSNSDAYNFKTYYDENGDAQTLAEENQTAIPASGSTPVQLDLTDYYENGFVFETQSRAVFKITYTMPNHMSVTIKETGYATLWAPYAVTIPEGIEAYTAKLNDSKDKLVMTAVSTTIPAETAVILHTETPATYSFVEAADVTAINNNVLKGQATAKEVSANSVYTLGLGGDDNTVGMRSFSGTSIRAYSAYMDAPAGEARFLTLSFDDDETTGITSTALQLSTEQYFNLAGQRVAQPTRGIYIVNGKKVVIR